MFPDHPLLTLDDPHVLVAPIADSPKPPPQRITFTLHALNHLTKEAVFVTTGASKPDVVARVAVPVSRLEPNPLPAGRVRPVKGTLTWFLDEAAASKL